MASRIRCASPPASVPAGAVQREVVEADVEQEPQPLVDLLEHPLGDLRSRSVELERRAGTRRTRRSAARRPRRSTRPADGHRQDLGLEPGAAAGRAGHLAHVALVPLAGCVALGLGVPALDERDRRPRSWCSTSARGRSGSGSGRAPGRRWPCRIAFCASGREPLATACRCRSRASSASASQQPAEVVAGRGRRPTARSRPRRGSAPGRGRPAPGRPPSGCRARCTPGRRRTAQLNENDRGSSSSKRAGRRWGRRGARRSCRSRCGSSSGRSTKSRMTRPPARPSAVSTESVSRRLAARLDREPVDDHLDGVLLLLLQLSAARSAGARRRRPGPGSSPWSAARGTGRRTRPCAPRTTGASTWNRVPSAHLEHPVDDLLRGLPGDRLARRSGSAAGRCGRRAAGGSRRPR